MSRTHVTRSKFVPADSKLREERPRHASPTTSDVPVVHPKHPVAADHTLRTRSKRSKGSQDIVEVLRNVINVDSEDERNNENDKEYEDYEDEDDYSDEDGDDEEVEDGPDNDEGYNNRRRHDSNIHYQGNHNSNDYDFGSDNDDLFPSDVVRSHGAEVTAAANVQSGPAKGVVRKEIAKKGETSKPSATRDAAGLEYDPATCCGSFSHLEDAREHG